MRLIVMVHGMDALEKHWRKESIALFEADGSDPKFPFNIAANSNMADTMHALGLRYLRFCNEKFLLLTKKVKLDNLLMGDEDFDYTASQNAYGIINNRLKAMDTELAHVNTESLKQIIQSKGFDRLRSETSAIEDRTLALKILTPVIHHAVMTTFQHSGYMELLKNDPLKQRYCTKGIVPKTFAETTR